MKDDKVRIAQGVRICHNARNTILFNPRTFERLELNENAGSLIKILEKGEKKPEQLSQALSETLVTVDKESVSLLNQRLSDFLEKLIAKGFLSVTSSSHHKLHGSCADIHHVAGS